MMHAPGNPRNKQDVKLGNYNHTKVQEMYATVRNMQGQTSQTHKSRNKTTTESPPATTVRVVRLPLATIERNW